VTPAEIVQSCIVAISLGVVVAAVYLVRDWSS